MSGEVWMVAFWAVLGMLGAVALLIALIVGAASDSAAIRVSCIVALSLVMLFVLFVSALAIAVRVTS